MITDAIAIAVGLIVILLLAYISHRLSEHKDEVQALSKHVDGLDNLRSERHWALEREFRQARQDLDELARHGNLEWREEPRKLVVKEVR